MLSGCGATQASSPQAPSATTGTNGATTVATADQNSTAASTDASSDSSATWYLSIEQVLTNNGFITAVSQDGYPRSTYKSEIPPYEDMLEVELPGKPTAVLGFTPAEPGPDCGNMCHDAEYRAYCADGRASGFEIDVYPDSTGQHAGMVNAPNWSSWNPDDSESRAALQEALSTGDLSHLMCSSGALSYTG